MEEPVEELNALFAPNGALPDDVLHELLSITRIYSLSPQEMFFKWESYSLKMNVETAQTTYKTIKEFRKDLDDTADRESRAKIPSSTKKQAAATPRTNMAGDSFLDGMLGSTPARSGSIKRKTAGEFQTPASKAMKNGMHSSPLSAGPNHVAGTTFADRSNAGTIVESLNQHLPAASPPTEPSSESRVKLKANTELQKFAYKPMSMQITSSSEILDERIDSFIDLVQKQHELPDASFGNAAAQSTAEIVAVGRIACDQPNGKLNAASIVLEMSRRMGAGMRVPLRFADDISYDVFPGKIIAVRGTNVSGEYFTVSEVLSIPLVPPAASTATEIDVHNDRLTGPDGQTRALSLRIAGGPYTTDTDLDFAALYTLLEETAQARLDVLILTGPFLDLNHPVVASGDFESHLPADAKINPDRATLNDVFRVLIGQHLTALIQAHPTITVIMVPSMRDAISKHVSFPQDRFPKAMLGLPKQVQVVTNPITISINDMILGISSQDVLSELRRDNVYHSATAKFSEDMLARLSSHIIEQRHFFPVFPAQAREDAPKVTPISDEVLELGGEERLPVGASLDLEYMKLAEWLNVLPDVLVTPSALTPFAKVIQGVLCINPGTISKKKGPGTFAALNVQPRQLSDEERIADLVTHKIYERARVDITRI